jgi:predicted RNase H-like nuclease (RuvC/YqgF family)
MKTLYPGLRLSQHGEMYSLEIDIETAHGKGVTSFDLVKQMPEIQEAINRRCADILITPIIDWKKECEELKDKVGILEQDIKAKQMVIDNMNLNYTTQEAKIKQLQRDLANAKKTGSGLFGWMRR